MFTIAHPAALLGDLSDLLDCFWVVVILGRDASAVLFILLLDFINFMMSVWDLKGAIHARSDGNSFMVDLSSDGYYLLEFCNLLSQVFVVGVLGTRLYLLTSMHLFQHLYLPLILLDVFSHGHQLSLLDMFHFFVELTHLSFELLLHVGHTIDLCFEPSQLLLSRLQLWLQWLDPLFVEGLSILACSQLFFHCIPLLGQLENPFSMVGLLVFFILEFVEKSVVRQDVLLGLILQFSFKLL